MTRQEVIDRLMAMYQIDPAAGSRWTETSDIEEAMYWASRIGKGFLGNHVITYDGTGYSLSREAAR